MLTGVQAFDKEWAEAQARTLAEAETLLAAAGASAEMRGYVKDMKGYPRIPYLSALWVPERDCRVAAGAAVCVHAIGIKLIDDLLDQDQPHSRWDQALGVFLIQSASALLAQHENAARAMNAFARDYEVFWRMQLREAAIPPRTLSEWIAYARVKSGLMMANYADVACLMGGALEAIPVARDFAEAVGVLFMIGDDLRDFDEANAPPGNLVSMTRRRVVSPGDILASLDEWRERACGAIRSRPASHDLSPFIRNYVQRLHGLVAPRVAGD